MREQPAVPSIAACDILLLEYMKWRLATVFLGWFYENYHFTFTELCRWSKEGVHFHKLFVFKAYCFRFAIWTPLEYHEAKLYIRLLDKTYYLPPYSPKLNPIEQFWTIVKKTTLNVVSLTLVKIAIQESLRHVKVRPKVPWKIVSSVLLVSFPCV